MSPLHYPIFTKLQLWSVIAFVNFLVACQDTTYSFPQISLPW